jgi:hypothetical protein
VHPAALEVADLEVGELFDVVTGQVQRLLAVCNGANVDQPQTVMNPTYSERQGQFLSYTCTFDLLKLNSLLLGSRFV